MASDGNNDTEGAGVAVTPAANGLLERWKRMFHAETTKGEKVPRAAEEEKVPEDEDCSANNVVAQDVGSRQRPAGRSVRRYGSGRLSMASSMFDTRGKGYLTKTEQAARAIADEEGAVAGSSVVALMKENIKLKRYSLILIVLTLLLGSGMVIMGTKLGSDINMSTKTTEVKIDQAVTTEAKVDARGTPHLVEKGSGTELTVRSEGDTFDAVVKTDPVTGRKLHCIPVNQVAAMVSDISSGTSGSVVFKDADGLSQKVMSIAGDYEDFNEYLQFHSFRVDMDDDGCNKGSTDAESELVGLQDENKDGAIEPPEAEGLSSSTPGAVGGAPPSEANNLFPHARNSADESKFDTLAEGEPAVAMVEGNELFKRHLRSEHRLQNPLDDKTSEVLAKHRLEYTRAHAAIKEGRGLWSDNKLSVPVSSSLPSTPTDAPDPTDALSNANSCPSLKTESACLAAKDGRRGHFFSDSPCAWCCGDACRSSNANKCEPSSWLLAPQRRNYIGHMKNGIGTDTCPSEASTSFPGTCTTDDLSVWQAKGATKAIYTDLIACAEHEYGGHTPTRTETMTKTGPMTETMTQIMRETMTRSIWMAMGGEEALYEDLYKCASGIPRIEGINTATTLTMGGPMTETTTMTQTMPQIPECFQKDWNYSLDFSVDCAQCFADVRMCLLECRLCNKCTLTTKQCANDFFACSGFPEPLTHPCVEECPAKTPERRTLEAGFRCYPSEHFVEGVDKDSVDCFRQETKDGGRTLFESNVILVKDHFPKQCMDVVFDVRLAVQPNPHFFLLGVMQDVGKNEGCPHTIMMNSIDGKKVMVAVHVEDVQDLPMHALGTASLGDILQAEENAQATDPATYDVFTNSCVHYARSIWRTLGVAEDGLAEFLIETIVNDDHMIELMTELPGGFLGQLAHTNGGKRSFKKYVTEVVHSELGIGSDVTGGLRH